MRITVLAGGVGGARFLRGLRRAAPDAEITVIGNTGDDISLFGLHVCPDLDTVMYTLGGGISEEQGWGRDRETHVVQSELAAYGAGPDWFSLGDRDFATHIARTRMLRSGLPLSVVTQRLCERWQPGVMLLPMTDDDVQTHVLIDDGDGRRSVHFQEWWVRLHAKVPALRFVAAGADSAAPAPGVLAAIGAAHYGPELLDGWLVDTSDAGERGAAELAGISVRALPLYMTDPVATAAIATAAIDLARERAA